MQCYLCQGDFKHLGSHLKKHKITARNYKKELGMDLNLPLMEVEIIQKKREAFWHNPVGLKNLQETRKQYQFKKGERSKATYISNQTKQRLKSMCRNRLIQDQIGDIYENKHGMKRRRIENILWHEDKVIYTTSWNNNGIWSDFRYDVFNYCTREQFHKSGKKIN